MKKSYFSLLCIIAFNSIISFNIKAQDFAPFRYDTESEVYDNFWKAGGELFVDDFAVVEDIKAPSGYKPFYISLFGRENLHLKEKVLPCGIKISMGRLLIEKGS